jgi:hypothetical protein
MTTSQRFQQRSQELRQAARWSRLSNKETVAFGLESISPLQASPRDCNAGSPYPFLFPPRHSSRNWNLFHSLSLVILRNSSSHPLSKSRKRKSIELQIPTAPMTAHSSHQQISWNETAQEFETFLNLTPKFVKGRAIRCRKKRISLNRRLQITVVKPRTFRSCINLLTTHSP